MALSLDDLKNMSPKRKALILFLAFLVLGYFYYFLFFQSLYDRKANLDVNLSGLKQQIHAKQLAVKDIQKSRQELVVLRESLQLALTKLPDRREIPGLLSSLAQAGRGAGLDFVQFEPLPVPKPPAPKKGEAKPAAPSQAGGTSSMPAEPEKFYDEIPFKVVLSGGFHNTVNFLEHVAKLPRIVSVTDIAMETPRDAKDDGSVLVSACMMKTYVFVEKPDAKKK